MKRIQPWMIMALVLSSAGLAANAQILLRERAINQDGTFSDDPYGAALPALGGAFSGVIDVGTGLGTMTLNVSGAGAHFIGAFLDHDIDKFVNTSFNELGSAFGAPSAGQSWELGDPYSSNIANDFAGSALTDSSLLTGASVKGGDDVSMALGWDFLLASDEIALVSWTASTQKPAGGFYLQQTDPDSSKNIYFTSTLDIRTVGTGVPDGGSTLALLGGGLAILQALRLRRQARN